MSAQAAAAGHPGQKEGLFGLTLGAIGVVYGDIGTSPLYAFREAMLAVTGHGVRPVLLPDVLGVLSMILWAIMLIVTLKYVIILLKVDNQGEGGPLALMALVRSAFYSNTRAFLLIGMLATAFFYGDSIITPAISVLSAVEGMKVVAPGFSPFVLPATVAIIIGLFTFQAKGTAKVSTLFGPITAVWFLTMGLTGLAHIGDAPEVLHALNPWHAAKFMVRHNGLAFVTLGAVFLAVTGAEALYTDLGHFGRKPIQIAWVWFILPCLTLNYLGQGALVLQDPAALDTPFFKMVGPSHIMPLVLLATCATVIASQAVITGTFSLAAQAVNLGMLPRMTVKYTSDRNSGQIYMPQVNWMLMTGVLILVFAFRSSEALASAYGISVTVAMLLDAVMIFFVFWKLKEWNPVSALLVAVPLLLIDGTFLASNLLKFFEGGWMPVMVAGVLVTLMITWVRGTVILNSRAMKRSIRLEKFVKNFARDHAAIARVPGTAFFMVGDPALVPASLLQNLRHNRVLHEKNIILSIRIEESPYVDPSHRSVVQELSPDFKVLVMRFGFKDTPDVLEELHRLNHDPESPLGFDWEKTSLFLNRRVLRSHPKYGLPMWQDFLFIWMSRNASDPSDYYRLPLGRVIELGRHVVI